MEDVMDGVCDRVCDGVWLFGKDSFKECPLTVPVFLLVVLRLTFSLFVVSSILAVSSYVSWSVAAEA